MSEGEYPSGPDLSGCFTPGKAADHPLPPAFDDSCKRCGTSMERMPDSCWTRRKPFATFQCTDCKVRLFLFEAPVTPLLIWSNTIPSASSMKFSDFIDWSIGERERKREIRTLREKGVLEV